MSVLLLHKVKEDELEAVKTWLELYLPESWPLYYLARTVLSGRWRGEAFYTLGWPAIRGVVNVQVEQEHPCVLYRRANNIGFIYAVSDEDVQLLLNLDEVVDWSKSGFIFRAIPLRIARAVEQIAKARGLEKAMRSVAVDTFRARPGEITLRLPPSPFKVRPVKTDPEEMAYCVSTSKSEFRMPHSEQYLRTLAHKLPSICVADEHDACISFELGTAFGSIGSLHTKETHRGQGLAKVVVSHLADEYRKLDLDVYTTVVAGNEPSFKLHHSLGFKHMEDLELCYLIYRNPQKAN